MTLPRHFLAATVVTAVLLAAGLLLFFQRADPAALAIAIQGSMLAWVVALVYHLLTRGIPIRILSDERR